MRCEDPAWDVIIADYHLPGFDAPGALRILQECGHDIPCIVVSGMMGEDTAVEMMKSGAHDYLTKNNLARLVPAVERELAEAARRRESRQAQEELRESEERLALAVEATQIGTFDFYPQTGKLIWSKFARQHYGVSPEAEVTYDTFLTRSASCRPRPRNCKPCRMPCGHENGGNYAHEYRTVGIEDGQERWISSRGRVFFDAEIACRPRGRSDSKCHRPQAAGTAASAIAETRKRRTSGGEHCPRFQQPADHHQWLCPSGPGGDGPRTTLCATRWKNSPRPPCRRRA